MEYGLTQNQQEYRQFVTKIILSRLSGSTVLSVEAVENIERSVNYVLNHSSIVGSPEERYQNGRLAIENKVRMTQELYQKIADYPDYGVAAIKGSIAGFKDFFQQYELSFGAHLIPGAWVDYQLSEAVDEQYQGIDFVWQYLSNFYAEMQFLNKIPEAIIINTLKKYSYDLGFDYRIDVNNVYEVIFNQSIVQMYLAKGNFYASALELSEQEAAYVLASKAEIYAATNQLQIIKENPYYQRTLEKLRIRLTNISSISDLKGLLLVRKRVKDQIISEPPLSAQAYLQLTSAIEAGASLRYIAEKIESPFDLIALEEERLLTETDFSKVVTLVKLNVFIAFLLWVKTENRWEWYQVEDIVKLQKADSYIVALQQRIKEMSLSEIEMVNQSLNDIEAADSDFS